MMRNSQAYLLALKNQMVRRQKHRAEEVGQPVPTSRRGLGHGCTGQGSGWVQQALPPPPASWSGNESVSLLVTRLT